MAAYIILLLAMSYLSSKWSTQFKGIDSEMVVELPSNITFNLKVCTLSSARKVAFNNMVLDIVNHNVRPTRELPLLSIASILTTTTKISSAEAAHILKLQPVIAQFGTVGKK